VVNFSLHDALPIDANYEKWSEQGKYDERLFPHSGVIFPLDDFPGFIQGYRVLPVI
jgi:hypothetical protein